MIGYIYPCMITTLNCAILGILAVSLRKHYIGRLTDINFHSRMLLLCTCLFIANTFAFITGIYQYMIIHTATPEILNAGRFADRYVMFFSYLALDRIDKRY